MQTLRIILESKTLEHESRPWTLLTWASFYEIKQFTYMNWSQYRFNLIIPIVYMYENHSVFTMYMYGWHLPTNIMLMSYIPHSCCTRLYFLWKLGLADVLLLQPMTQFPYLVCLEYVLCLVLWKWILLMLKFYYYESLYVVHLMHRH